jgi:hypothetical protein
MHTRDDGGHDADREDTTPDMGGHGESAHTMEDGTTTHDDTQAKKKRKKKGAGAAAATE